MQGHIHKRVHTCDDGRVSTLWYVVVDLPRGVDGKRRQKWRLRGELGSRWLVLMPG